MCFFSLSLGFDVDGPLLFAFAVLLSFDFDWVLLLSFFDFRGVVFIPFASDFNEISFGF